jgi:Domain of unknown function (DUF4936)
VASFYVYYRVAPLQQAATQTAVLQLFALMQAQTGVAGRLQCRLDDATTWMEIYEGVADAEAFNSALQRNAEACGLQTLPGDAQRVIERFTDL